MKKFFTCFAWFCQKSLNALLVIFVGGAITIVGVYFYFAKDLPEIDSIEDYHPPVISEVFSDDGTKIGEFWTECRIFVNFDEIPKLLQQAFISSEDDRFYEHKGIDMRAILRAVVANFKAGSIKQGGSTITQQVTRSLLLSRKRTYTRKIKEAILATRIERTLTKNQILTLYLNQIFLGNRSYGVAAAARNYFRKTVEELTLGEITLIAGLPTAPARYSPLVRPQQARIRQQRVLQRMYDEGHITEAQMRSALAEEFELYRAGTDKFFTDPDAAHFVEHVRRIVKERYGDKALYHRGLKIYTTAHLPTQRAAMKTVKAHITKLDKRQGFRGPNMNIPKSEISAFQEKLSSQHEKRLRWKLAYWPPGNSKIKTRSYPLETNKLYDAIVIGIVGKKVKIHVGNTQATISHAGYKWARKPDFKKAGVDDFDYITKPQEILKIGDVIKVKKLEDASFVLSQVPKTQAALFAVEAKSGFTKAIIGGNGFTSSEFNRATQSLRSPGSAFKPFVFAAALDKGYTFETTIIDEPAVYQVDENEYWSPKNYSGKYEGATTFRRALLLSRNVPTVKIAFDIGVNYLTAFLRKLGITTPIAKYLSMSLGANGVYLSELVQAYSVFVNNGIYQPNVFIKRIEDAKGEVLESAVERNHLSSQIVADAAPQTQTMQATIDSLQASDLNLELFGQEQRSISEDRLSLTDLEIQTLYGKNIPAGHVISPQTAHMMVQLLQDVVTAGTGSAVRALGKPAGGKTGTTNDETDAWFVGFVPDLIAGVWVGFDELKPIGKRETGGKTAAPIFLDFAKAATIDWEAKQFEAPPGFPLGNIAELTGGSALEGVKPQLALPGERSGLDRAGTFFEEDLEPEISTSENEEETANLEPAIDPETEL